MRYCLLLLLATYTNQAFAEIPAEYNPVVVEAPFSFSERVFDLTGAVEKGIREDKPLYIYLGAADCPPCRNYSWFLKRHRGELKDAFDRVVIVDIRTWLNGPGIVFKVGDQRYSFAEFKTLVGDTNKKSLTYPYYWIVTPTLKQLKQLPQGGSRHYTSIQGQINILRLP